MVLWHGIVFRALQVGGDLEMDLDVDDAGPGERELVKTLGEFRPLHRGQRQLDPELRGAPPLWRGDLQRLRGVGGNRVVSKRMVKKQQMRWTPRGAHLLLQVRTRVLNDGLADAFRRWYPEGVPAPKAALAA